MSTAIESLSTAAERLDRVLDDLKTTGNALDGVSDALVDRVQDAASRCEETRASVVRARDALESAGA
jgi:hypothetical protein